MNEIKRLVDESGKPLEVQCAEVFLKESWQVRLATFYTDIASQKIRELDFLAQRDFPFKVRNLNNDSIDWNVTLRILGSCKGFPSENNPLTYSVFSNSRTVEQPRFICYECGLHGRNVAEAMGPQMAGSFLRQAGLSDGQQVIGFDIVEREELPLKQGKKGPPQIKYSRIGDRDLYEGLDSAVKAALFWYLKDRESFRVGGSDRGYIALSIPLLVTSHPFLNVSIDKGTAGVPELRSSGFHVSLYPSGHSERPPEPVMSILWQASKLAELTRYLGQLINELVPAIQTELKRSS